MKNFVSRTLSGAVYVALIIFSLIFHKYSFLVLFIILSSIMVYELSKGFNTLKEVNIRGSILIILNVVVFLSFFFAANLATNRFYVFAITPILIIPLVELFQDAKNSILNTALSFFIILYIALPFGLANFLYFNEDGSYSYKLLLSIYILIWVNDTFAYLSGMLLGRHKLFERISPKKTWEGFIGGGVFSVGAAIALSKIFLIFSLPNWIVIALIVTIFGTAGDLIESMLKRQLKLKDIGNIMPGHGGILDRNDSFIFVVPAVCLFLQILNLIS